MKVYTIRKRNGPTHSKHNTKINTIPSATANKIVMGCALSRLSSRRFDNLSISMG